MSDAANTRLRAVTDVAEPRPKPTDPLVFVVLGGLGAAAAAALLAINWWTPGFLGFITLATAVQLLAESLGQWLVNRAQKQWRGTPVALLDAAPLEIPELRAPAAFMAVFFVVMLVSGGLLLLGGDLWWGLGFGAIGALGVVTSALRLRRPWKLRIDSSGFRGRGPLIAWSDVMSFRADRGPHGPVDYHLGTARRERRLFGGGGTGSLQADGPIPADKLAELMNAAKARWG
jgi:hypothetical protein